MSSGRVEELWVYPVKSCGGIRVSSAVVTPTGLEHDRIFCIVDRDGTLVSSCEAISKRKLPALATITTAFGADRREIVLHAPGMPELRLPTAEVEYANAEDLEVKCSGRSTTAANAGGWSFGSIPGKISAAGSEWVATFLNGYAGDDANNVVAAETGGQQKKKETEGEEEEEEEGRSSSSSRRRRRSGKSKQARFALVRTSSSGLAMTAYNPEFPLLRDPAYTPKMRGNYRHFSDFAPFLLVNRASARDLARLADVDNYPTGSFRGNIIVDSEGPWEEEHWGRLEIRPAASGAVGVGNRPEGLMLRKIKECPRCTIPCRSEKTGEFLFPGHSLKLWDTLKAVFPKKASDPQWGSWAGVYFGVYFGHAGASGARIRVGDCLYAHECVETQSGWRLVAKWLAVSTALAVGAGAHVL
eukprot:UC1_evm1s486